MLRKQLSGPTYTRHEFEDRGLCIFEELDHLAQTLEHCIFVTDRSSHSAGQAVTQVVINIEFARRAGGEEGIVQS